MKKELRQKLIEFQRARHWEDYHTGPELARALMVEAAELNRLFMWGSEPAFHDSLENLQDELADIAIYLEYLLMRYNIDIDRAVEQKIEKNAIKYPVEKD